MKDTVVESGKNDSMLSQKSTAYLYWYTIKLLNALP